MKVMINNERQNRKLENHIRNRLEFAVGRHADRIEHIEVHVREEEPENDGREKTCSIDMKLIPRGQVHVSGKNKNIYAAATSAVRRAARIFSKTIERRSSSRRTHRNPHDVPQADAAII